MKTSEQYSDIEIIKRVLDGELALFELLIRRNNSLLYKTGRSYHYNHEDTQDLMQDTFVDAYSNLSKFEYRSSFRTWLVRIMLNNCFRRKKKSSFKYETADEIHDKSIPMFTTKQNTDTTQSVLNRELSAIVENALLRIPSDYRMVFSLREVNGFSIEETAETLSITPANVKVRLHRAKALLRKEVESFYKTEDIFEFNLIYCDAMVSNVMNRLKLLTNKPD